MFIEYVRLALKNLKKRGIRSFLTLLGIIIGIAAVVALISLGQGLATAITGQFSSLSADRLIVTNAETGFGPPGSTSVKKLTEHDQEILERVPGVVDVVPRLIRVIKSEYNDIVNFEYIGSLPEDQEQAEYLYSSFQLEAESGHLLDSDDHGFILIGNDFKTDNGYEKDIRVGTHLKLADKDFEVIGILKKAGSFQFNQAIFMTEEDMKDVLSIGDEFDLFMVRIENPDRVESVANEITRKLRKDRDLKEGEEDFSVETPVKAIESISTILTVVNIVIAGIAAISLLIGAIGVTNTLFTSVVERTKEIGIMKAIGARNRAILSVFMIESALLGLIGGIFGAALGLGLAFLASTGANIAFGTELFTVSPSWILLGASIIFSSLIGILAGIIPAYQASRLNPVEALRK